MKNLMLPLAKFYEWEENVPEYTFLKQPIDGQCRTYSFGNAGNEIRRIAAALKALNLPQRSRIAILSKNCAHWIMTDMAIWMSGHVAVPLYPTMTSQTIKEILQHSETSVIFLGKLDNYHEQQQGIHPSVKKISFPFYGPGEGLLWDDLLKRYAPIAGRIDRSPSDLMTISYTSGTTGKMKGAMFTFEAFAHAIDYALSDFDKYVHAMNRPTLFSFLPLSHVAERMLVEFTSIYRAGCVSFVESLETFPDDLAGTQPEMFFGVPRIWFKFREKVLEKLPQQKLDRLLRIPVVRSLVQKRIQKALGLSKAKICLSAAAPIPVELIDWFKSLGVTIREVYGMTENCGVTTGNLMGVKIGSVGLPIGPTKVRIGDEGEVQVKHLAMMSGYYKDPDVTATTFTPDGYLKTGDQGELDQDGFLWITGRLKDLFKTDKGKYVAPAPIEMKLLRNVDIEQVCVVGAGLPQPMALTVLSETGKSKPRAEITECLRDTLRDINSQAEHHERLAKTVILNEPWTIENGLMTPTMKVKRHEIEKIHMPNYASWYATEKEIVWEGVRRVHTIQ